MDYYTQASPRHLINDGAEQRRTPRKALRQKVSLGTPNHGIISGHTVDISVGGLSVMIPTALAIDSLCVVRFELFVDGSLIRFAGNGQVANCSCAGMDGFRVGMTFKLQDSGLQAPLNAFLAR